MKFSKRLVALSTVLATSFCLYPLLNHALKAHEPPSIATVHMEYSRATLLIAEMKWDEAIETYQSAISEADSAFGPDSSMASLIAGNIEQARAMKNLHATDAGKFASWSDRSKRLNELVAEGRFAQWARDFHGSEDVLTKAADNSALQARGELDTARASYLVGEYQKAVEQLENLLSRTKEIESEKSYFRKVICCYLMFCYLESGNAAELSSLQKEAELWHLEADSAFLPGSPAAIALGISADLMMSSGNFAEASRYIARMNQQLRTNGGAGRTYIHLLEGMRQKYLGDADASAKNLLMCYQSTESLSPFEDLVLLWRLRAIKELVYLQLETSQPGQAEESLTELKRVFGHALPERAFPYDNINGVESLMAFVNRDYPRATELSRMAVSQAEEKYGKESLVVADQLIRLANSLIRSGQAQEATSLLRRARRIALSRLGGRAIVARQADSLAEENGLIIEEEGALNLPGSSDDIDRTIE